MTVMRRILVPIKSLTGRSAATVLKAAQLARATRSSIELYHVLRPSTYPASFAEAHGVHSHFDSEVRETALRRLEALADRVRSHEIKVSVSVGWDYPEYEAIIRRACAIKADLIVASQHAGRHRWRFFLKLTDWELVRLSPIPVLLVKNQNPYRHPAVLAAIDPAHSHRKPEMLDAAILRAAGEWSTALRGTLHAVHAYDRFPINMPPEALKSGALDDLQAQADQLAAKRFSHALTTARVARKRQYLIPASPVEAIGEAVRSSRSAILVMGVISRSGIKRLLIGNTAENLLDVLSCDILVIKPPTFRSGVPGRTSARARGLIAQDPPPRRGPPSRVHSV